MRSFLAVTLLCLLSICAVAQTTPPPSPPDVTAFTPQAVKHVGLYGDWNGQPAAGAKHFTFGGYVAIPATMTDTAHPGFFTLSTHADGITTPGCKGCITTSFRLGYEQALFTKGQFTTLTHLEYGVNTGGPSTTGSLGFSVDEFYKFKTPRFFTHFGVGFMGDRNGSAAVVKGIGFRLNKEL